MTISWTSITLSIYGKAHRPHTASGGRRRERLRPPALLQRAAECGEALALGGLEQPAVERREDDLSGGRRFEHPRPQCNGGRELDGIHAAQPVGDGEPSGRLLRDRQPHAAAPAVVEGRQPGVESCLRRSFFAVAPAQGGGGLGAVSY